LTLLTPVDPLQIETIEDDVELSEEQLLEDIIDNQEEIE
jgi:hypothetical protein